MAKGNRFPSPANMPAKGSEKRLEVLPEKTVTADEVDGLVVVEYKKDNHHVIDPGGVYAVSKGTNYIPLHIWEKAALTPAVQQLVDDGDLVVISKETAEEEQAEIAQEAAELALKGKK